MPQDETNSGTEKPSTTAVVVQGLAKVFTGLVETFGLPGAILILVFWFVVWYATDEQKQRIIETYILGTGVTKILPIAVISVLATVVVLAQRRWYIKQLKKLTEEIEREGQEKSLLQEAKIGATLRHATTKTEVKGK